MIRRLALLVALAGTALPALGARRMTVAQLEQTLAKAHGEPDAKVANQLSDVELTETLSGARLAQLKTNLPGEKSLQQLTILADQSAFLNPPATDIPSTAAPSLAEQRTILSLTVSYVSQTIHQLPNFIATRVTTSFEDTPPNLGAIAIDDYQPLHRGGTSSATVQYRDGHEIIDTTAVSKKKQLPSAPTLTTSGVFGPILTTVLVDAARSKLAWGHWEQDATGLQAVFNYVVPIEKSHYTMNFGCTSEQASACPGFERSLGQVVAYHGEIAIDPATGTILRLMLLADPKPGDLAVKSGIVVEYGRIDIGGKTYFCPVRSIATTTAHAFRPNGAEWSSALATQQPLKTSINDVAFEQYHIFRGNARVITSDEAEKQNQPQPASAAPQSTTSETENAALAPPAAPEASPAKSSSISIPVQPAESAPPPSIAPPAPIPDIPTTQAPILMTTARAVVVDVVVTKGNGDPVLGLGQRDFTVTENGQPQTINFFEEHTAARQPSAAAPPAMPPLPQGAITNVAPAPLSDSVNVLLLDTLNTEQQDQAYVHHQIMDFLTKMQPGTRVAIFMLGSKLRFVQGFTADTSLLLAALNDKRSTTRPDNDPSSRKRSDTTDDAADVGRLQMMQASPFAIAAIQEEQADARVHDDGERASLTFQALIYIGHYLAGVPGRKNLIWFASSFPVTIFPTVEQRDRLKQNPALPGYTEKVKTTADLFTVAKIAVYPISAEGMRTEHIAEADAAGPGAPVSVGHVGSQSDSTMAPYNAAAGERASKTFAMQQLADSTGGKAFSDTNDLSGAIKRAINDGANYYTVGYAPTNNKMDGAFRQINVKLAKSKYKLGYRHGYNADPGPTFDPKSISDPLGPLLAFGLPPASGVLYGVKAAPATAQPAPTSAHAGENSALNGPLTRFAVDFVVRTEDVVSTPGNQGERSARMLFGLKAYDRAGNAVNWLGDEETLEIKADDYEALQKSGVKVHLEIDLPAHEDLRLVTAVYDWNTGNAGTIELPLHP